MTASIARALAASASDGRIRRPWAAWTIFLFLASLSAGCVDPVCGPKDSWRAKWDNPGLLDHLPTDNKSHPDWYIHELAAGRDFLLDRGDYDVQFQVYGTKGGTHFTIRPEADIPRPAKEVAQQEYQGAVREFAIEPYVTTMHPTFEPASDCG